MKCYNNRTLFNVFDYYDCSKCTRFLKDEELFIEERKVYLYHSYKGCIDYLQLNPRINYDLYIAKNKRIKLFLKDMVINQLNNKDCIYLWLEDFDFNNEYNMEIIYSLLGFGLDIQIIT